MRFPKRQLEIIVKQICQKNKIQFKSLSEGFILQLTKNNKTEYLYGYNFPCNNVTASKICDDKAGCSEILTQNKIACMEHVFFMDGFYKDAEVLAIFKKFKNDVVVKPNTGTGGRDVYHCKTKQELLNNIKKVLSHSINFTISPFYTYDTEYRLIMYKDKAHIIYAKQRTTEWRHNLGLGAKVNEYVVPNTIKKLSTIAQRCVKTLKIKFCSVDIAELKNKQFKVVELNGGVMMEKYSLANYKKAYSLYERVIKDIFAI